MSAGVSPVATDGKDVLLRVFIQPRASRNEVVGRHDDALRIRVAAPPVDGAANQALCRFLAELCRVPPSSVRIEKGESGRRKVIRIRGPVNVPPILGDDAPQ
ncbi:MAG: YggU family protein [Pararhodobacter sp.]|nr:YggU family protein [Pararhodobacter sp.]